MLLAVSVIASSMDRKIENEEIVPNGILISSSLQPLILKQNASIVSEFVKAILVSNQNSSIQILFIF
jgi:hypothetical protein